MVSRSVGTTVGAEAVGDNVGSLVGADDGDAVGDAVGATVQPVHVKRQLSAQDAWLQCPSWSASRHAPPDMMSLKFSSPYISAHLVGDTVGASLGKRVGPVLGNTVGERRGRVGLGVGAAVGLRVTASVATSMTGHTAPPPVTVSGSTSNRCKSCTVSSRKRTVIEISVMPRLAGTHSSSCRRFSLPRRNPLKKSLLGQSSISIIVLLRVIVLPCEALSVSRTASTSADCSTSLPIARVLSSGQLVWMVKVGLSFCSVGAGLGAPVVGAMVVSGADIDG